ncbi:SdrD B-like domain-containing protein [Thiothrix lacustris]|uniref:SdrD B-like domain-containing protein n=1 Tax=Thiothrix lacustris TaxID=525917 RepID=UPI00048BC285|nr:SdrD B-like domain-containing protein [Thiothrix lacustris]
MAYRRDTKKLYASAVLRRYASEGDLGFGGIYELDPTNPTAAPVKWFTVADTGTLAARGIPADGGPSHDIEAYQKIGKASLGDIDISEDGKTLYAMNLNTRSLVPIDMATKTAGTPIPVTDPGCSSADDVRPWAVNVHEGEVYVGVVCSDESAGSITSKFKAYVMKLTGSSFTTVASMPLDYEKDWAAPGAYPTPKEACEAQRGWFPWTSNPADFTSFAGCRGTGDADKNTVIHPQPVLSDIEFDVDGSIVLGFLDRLALQAGAGNYAPDAANTALYANMGGGDIRRICNVGGSYVAEGGLGCAFNGGQNLSKNNEFYIGDRIMYSYNGDPTNLESAHSETSIGGLALRAGSGEVLMSTYDPIDDTGGSNLRWATQGVSWLSNTSGDKLDSFEIVSTTDQDFAKASGMGDLEVMCDEAPLEVGNRVWQDTNGNGIQDADEAGIDNVDVTLTCGIDAATVKTANGGQFLFSNKAHATFMKPGASCKITVALGQTALNGLSVTKQNADGVTDNNTSTDLRDSDAIPSGEITFTVGNAGENNHTLDIGYKMTPALHSIGNRVWIDANNNGVADIGESAVSAGVKLDLKNASGGVLNTTTTDVNGRYLFSGLDAGSYQVCVSADNFAASAVLAYYTASTGKTPVPKADTDNTDGDDNGSDDTANGLCSDLVTLGTDEPTGEMSATGNDGADGQGTPDTHSNLTVDFGIVPPMVVKKADLSLTKTANPTSVKRGDKVIYTLTVGNAGQDDATGVKVKESLPAGVTWVSDDGLGTYDNVSGIWTVGDINKDTSKVLSITVTVN